MKETLEEAAERLYLSYENNELLYGHSEDLQLAYKAGIFDGANYQAERSYSEEEVYNLLCSMPNFYNMTIPQQVEARDKWFEQFKKK